MEHFWPILGLALLSGSATLLGVVLALWIGRADHIVAAGLGFSAGIMLILASFELVPAALEAMTVWSTLFSAGAGVGFLALANKLIPHTHLIDETDAFKARRLKTAYLVLFGLVLHDFPEGFALTNSFLLEPSLGVLVAVSIALHNVPEEFAIAVPALSTKSRRLLFGGAIVSALAEPAGAILGLLAMQIRPDLNAVFLAFAAGAMVFVSLHELMPAARQYGRITLFAVGIGFSALTYLILAWLVTI
jgi:ZIP family zinc transporter